MLALPEVLEKVLSPYAKLFSKATWQKVQLLVVGALLTPRQRTVAAALRVMGLAQQSNFAKYHQVLNRASWSTFVASRILLGSLLRTFAPDGTLVFGVDETLERRWGQKIEAKGIYRDAVRSSHSHFVKCSGLRWLSLMLLAPVPWTKRVWALPVVTALAPSERYCQERKLRHKKLTDWARQLVFFLLRWLPERDIVVVTDSGYSALDLLHACQHLTTPVTVISRLRLDAALYEVAAPRKTGQMGRPRLKGKRLPTLAEQRDDPNTAWQSTTLIWYAGQEKNVEVASGTAIWYHTGKPPVAIRWVLIKDPEGKFDSQALLCTDLTIDPSQIITWFMLRWCLEVTFQEVRVHLGVETQRQWSSLAILRSTPSLFGLFSLVTLVAHELYQQEDFLPRRAAWYFKPSLTFSDALAKVRERLWRTSGLFDTSSRNYESKQIPAPLLDRLVETLCYAT